MKNQYFGDKRDYFKYSLLETLAAEVAGIERLTCIWMLTANTTNNDGRKQFVAHPHHVRLATFLQKRRAKGTGTVAEMRAYFKRLPFGFFSYGDRPPPYFGTEGRDKYFRDIPDAVLRRSVVFFDPDNGLEPAVTVTPAHLRHEELAEVFGRMDTTSIAVIYQHLPRIQGSVFWPSIATKLHRRLAASVGYIAEGDLAFFVVARDRSELVNVLTVLNKEAAAVAPGKQHRLVGHLESR